VAPSSFCIDVGDADFERAVVAASFETPVVVDFWAPWCAPCRKLGPLLERLAGEHQGAFVLAKVNVDESPEHARRYGARSIPMVIGLREGEVVSEFVGAQPEPIVRTFLARVLPTPADQLAREGERLAAAGDAAAAEARFREALALQRGSDRAGLGLARLLAARGEITEALEGLGDLLLGGRHAAEVERFAAELRTRGEGVAADPQALRRRIAEAPGDLAARLALGRAHAARGEHREALEELLEVVRRDPAFAEQAARKAMLDLFEVLGPDHELTQSYRSQLARALFR
jgi:putative thioredoxin